jgi:hypothetical protein
MTNKPLELTSKTLIAAYYNYPIIIDYDIKFTHFAINPVTDSKEEYQALEKDLANLKNYMTPDLFKIYLAHNSSLAKLIKNTNILDTYTKDIYFRVRNNTEYQEMLSLVGNRPINIVIDKDLLKTIPNLKDNKTMNIIVDVNTIKELPVKELTNLIASGLNIAGVNLGQKENADNDTEFDNWSWKKILEEEAARLQEPTKDYRYLEKNVNLENDIYTVAQYKAIDDKMKDTLVEAGINKDDNEEDKFKKIYLYVIKNVSYDWDGKDSNTLANQTILGSLFEHKCVCEGYAKLMQQLLSLVNIKSTIVGGGLAKDSSNSDEEGHLWNQVEIANKWYNSDATGGSYCFNNNYEVDKALYRDEASHYKTNNINAHTCNTSHPLNDLIKNELAPKDKTK